MGIISDFECLKISALKKASLISAEINHITIGPNSVVNKSDTDKLENIENEQNSCNIKSPPKSNTSPKYVLISTPSGITFSANKIHQESELQRQEEVRNIMQLHIWNMKESSRAIQKKMASTCSIMARECERRSLEERERILAEQAQLAEQEELERRQEQQLHAQRAQEQKERLERAMEEQRMYEQRMREREELIKSVATQRDQFMVKYCDIVRLTKACKDKQALNVLLMANAAKIKESYQQIEILTEKLKSGSLIAEDLNVIEALVCNIDDMLNLFRTEIEKIDAQYEAELARKAQTDNEVQSVGVIENSSPDKALVPVQQPNEGNFTENEGAEDQNLHVVTNQEVVASPSTNNAPTISSASEPKSEETSDFTKEEANFYEYVDEESLQIYVRSRQFLIVYRQNYNNFLQSPDTKKFRFECQKAINIPVNAISGISEQHLRDKYDRLQNLLTGKSLPNVTQHPQEIAFCKDHLAKKIVNQGETLVSSKPEMAFPVAAIVVALWNDHEDFGELFLAHLHEACPFIVPIFLPRQEGQSNEDYYKSLGYKFSEDGTFEKQDKFLKRISGLMRLYASVTVTGQRRGITKTHPHGLQYAWRWLAAVLNIKPRADTCDLCATLILDMLEVAGNVLWAVYSRQFHKLLIAIKQQYYPLVQDIAGTSGGPLVRLEEFLNNALAKNIIRPADGLLPPNFW